MARSINDPEDVKRQRWEAEDQPGELEYHRSVSSRWRWGPKWDEARNTLQRVFHFDYGEFADGTIMDIGSGPRSMLEWFEAKIKIAVEPLANKLRKEIGRHDLFQRMNHVYAEPAEERLIEWENKVDFIWCHNCLDHCWGWQRIIDNIAFYLRPGGKFYIGTDADKPPTQGHPGLPLREFMDYIQNSNLHPHHWRHRLDEDPEWVRTIGLVGRRQ